MPLLSGGPLLSEFYGIKVFRSKRLGVLIIIIIVIIIIIIIIIRILLNYWGTSYVRAES